MSDVEFIQGETQEPKESHFESQRRRDIERGDEGKSLVDLQAERDGGLYQKEPIIEKIVVNGEEHTVTDFIAPVYRDKFDENGYLKDPNDEFWRKTSCYQTSTLNGIYAASPELIEEYENNHKGTIGLIYDYTEEVDPEEAKYRDLIILRPGGTSFTHACNFVTKDETGETIVVTKDGTGPTVPIRLRKLSDVISENEKNYTNIRIEYRRERPSQRTATNI